MRKLTLILSLFIAIFAMSQEQVGYVKERGRSSNGKHIKGQGLRDAIITVNNKSAIKSRESGLFRFATSKSRFHITGVSKTGYVLSDYSIIENSYIYSANPLIILLDREGQTQKDTSDYQKSINKSLEKELKAKKRELETLKKKQKITEEKYEQAIEQLKIEKASAGALVQRMADYFSKRDFDQLNEIDQQINDSLINGHAFAAIALLKSKGDINTRIANQNKLYEANNTVRKDLEASEAVERMQREELANDLYGLYSSHITCLQLDSAAHYIVLRAELKPENMKWLYDAGVFFQSRRDPIAAESYFQRALQIARSQEQDTIVGFRAQLGQLLNNIALTYMEQGVDDKAEKMLLEAKSLFEGIITESPQFKPYYASTTNNLAALYKDNPDEYEKSEKLFFITLDIYNDLLQNEGKSILPQIAATLNNLGLLYGQYGYKKQSEEAFEKAIEIYSKSDTTYQSIYSNDIAATLINLSNLYYHEHIKAENRISLLEQAIDIYRKSMHGDSEAVAPLLAAALSNYSTQLYEAGKDNDAAKAFDECLDIYQWLATSTPELYCPILGDAALNQALREFKVGHYQNSEALYTISLNAFRMMNDKKDGGTFLPQIAKALRNQGYLYDKMGQWRKSIELFQEELNINQILLNIDPNYKTEVARSFGNMSFHSIMMKDFEKAIAYAKQGIECDSSKTFIQANLAAALLFTGQFEQAKDIYLKFASELTNSFLDDFNTFASYAIIPKEYEQDVEKIKQLIQMNNH